MEELRQDIRHAVGSLMARRSFTLAVIVTLAVGLGVTTAVASVVYTVVLAPAPYDRAEEIVQIVRAGAGGPSLMLPPADVRTIADQGSELFAATGVARFNDLAVTTGGAPERRRGVLVTGSTLAMLGVPPALGRLPDESDDVAGGPCLTVLSHDVWTGLFHGDPEIVGKAATLDGEPCTVTAVMPPDFAFPAPYFAPGELWLLAGPAGVDWTTATGPGFLLFGRVGPETSFETVRAGLEVISARDPEVEGRFTATRWAESFRERSQQRLLVLLVAAALVLIMACANVIALQMARNLDRRTEIATRMALGATPGRLVRLLMAETGVLVGAGAVAGLVVAKWSLDLIVALRSFFIPRMEEASINGLAVAVCFGLALALGLVTTWVAAWRLSRTAAAGSLAQATRGATSGVSGRRFGRTLVAVETTLAIVLLAGAALLYQSYRQLSALDPGFRTTNILTARVSPPATRYPDAAARAAFYREVEDRIAALPGVVDVGLTNVPPGVGAGATQPFMLVGGEPTPGDWPETAWRSVSDGYFRTLEIPHLRGDLLARHRGSPRPAVVNMAFVRRFLGGDEAIGRSLRRVESPRAETGEPDAWTIVGVVADVHEEFAYRPPPPVVYVPTPAAPGPSTAILLRTVGPPLELSPQVREAVAALDPEQPVWGVRDLESILRSEYDLNRLALTLLALFAATSLVLAIAGIYGVVGHVVGQRLREMAIRAALGARRSDLLRLVLSDVARSAALGAVAGLVLMARLGDRLQAMSPGWVGLEVTVLAGVTVLVCFVVLATAFFPTRDAADAEPSATLSEE